MRVLVIEDDYELGRLWKFMAEARGDDVVWARTVAAGVDALVSTGPFDVVFSDLMLGENAALGLLDYARVKSPSARIVLVTGASFLVDGRMHELSSAVDWVLHKPVPISDLRAILDYVEDMQAARGPMASTSAETLSASVAH